MNKEGDMDDPKRTQDIRTILLKDWDPLGVGDNPNLANEYDDYIPGILRLLDAHCTVDQLERYLRDIEEKWELAPDPGTSRAAKKIFGALKVNG
jgi:hypothetical protein